MISPVVGSFSREMSMALVRDWNKFILVVSPGERKVCFWLAFEESYKQEKGIRRPPDLDLHNRSCTDRIAKTALILQALTAECIRSKHNPDPVKGIERHYEWNWQTQMWSHCCWKAIANKTSDTLGLHQASDPERRDFRWNLFCGNWGCHFTQVGWSSIWKIVEARRVPGLYATRFQQRSERVGLPSPPKCQSDVHNSTSHV